MSVSGDAAAPGGWATRRATKRLGGMAEALSIAADLGFAVPLPSAVQEIHRTLSSSVSGNKSDELIRILRELTTVQRNIANLQVELQGRKDDKNVAYLIHVSEMEKKCESLSRITSILKDVIQNKDRIIARLQQPYSLDCIPVEAEYQKQFSELLLKAASDYSALTASVADFQWSQNFREPPTIWGEMLRPIPAALASCTRFFEAMSAMRESFTTLQQLRIGQSSLPMTPCDSSGEDSKFVTPPQCREGAINSDDSTVDSWRQQTVDISSEEADVITQRRLSWPPSLKKTVPHNSPPEEQSREQGEDS